MNYFAHACRFLDDPPLVVGTAVPDWLMVCDRAVRLRPRHAAGPATEWSGPAGQLARGILHHLEDDARFHNSDAFVELQLALASVLRPFVEPRAGPPIGFLSHLVLELLLDAALVAEDPGRLHAYYRSLQSVDAAWVQETVNRLAPRPSSRLAEMMVRFCQGRILWDYLADATLLGRLNQVLARTGLAPLPEGFCQALAEARPLVAAHRHRLLPPANGAAHPAQEPDSTPRLPLAENLPCVLE